MTDCLRYYHLLCDPTRFGIVHVLREAEKPLTHRDLIRELDPDGNQLNNHLCQLRQEGLIIRRANFGDDGRTHHYQVSDTTEVLVEPLLELMKNELAGIEDGFQTC